MESKNRAGYQVSPQQKRVWLQGQQTSPQGRGEFCVQGAIKVDGALDRERLQQALRMVMERHEILRTEYEGRAGMKVPLQVVETEGRLVWREVEVGGGEREQEEESKSEHVALVMAEERRAESAGEVRAVLVKYGEEEHVLVVSLSAMSGDAQTMRNMVEELGRSYLALLHGEELTYEPLQYVDFANWQQELLEGSDEEAEAGREYWRRQEAESAAEVRLSFERSSSTSSDFVPAFITLKLEPAVVIRLRAQAERLQSNVETYLLASWMVLLWRMSGETELVIGELNDGRKYEELSKAMGLYAKWLPVRLRLESGGCFADVLELFDEYRRAAFEWQEYFNPEEFAEASDRGTIGFEYEQGGQRYNVDGLTFRLDQQYTCIEKFKIKLGCRDEGPILLIKLSYDSALFQSENVERIAHYYETLLESAIENPKALIGDLNLLSQQERDQLLYSFNQTAAPYPKHKTVHQLFEEQVERTPERVAVVCQGQQLTYAALNASANRLARYLRLNGVSEDVRVGFCIDRSVEMLIGLLGILKAGGAYVPLNAEYPKKRLAHQIAEIGTPVLLTQRKLLDQLPDFAGEIICLDQDQSLYADQPEVNLDHTVDPQNLAYVIYTSGSTGVPKGVAVTHQSLVNYTSCICRELQLGEVSGERPLHFATVSTISADLGNTAIFPSLLSGGCLHVLNYDVTTDAQLFADYVRQHPIDVLKIVPSHLSALLSAVGEGHILPRLCLILGGEALPFSLIKRIQSLSTSSQTINHYGPTEATIGALINPLTESTEESATRSFICATVPVGCPIANNRAYILDEEMRPVPVGLAGELYLGGVGLARGYLNQPEHTGERFVPDPFSGIASSRLYRTGDLARYLPDGKIEFLGRVDDQVKIRGFRIELGEIETTLREHAQVKEAIVLARENEPGHKHLTAYVVGPQSSAQTAAELQDYLKERLPEYMVPSAFVMLDHFPLTANGKIDRPALPAPEQAQAASKKSYVAARTETERTLTAIWQEVLRTERVGIHDNFFHLGGDSILSIQIVARARQAGLHLTPKQIFHSQTVAELASVIGETPAPFVEQGQATGRVPLTPVQHRFFEQQIDNLHHFNQAVMLQVSPELDAPVLRSAWTNLLSHHDALRLRFAPVGNSWEQFYTQVDEEITFAQIDLSDVAEEEQRAKIETEAESWQRSLHLSDGPLVRMVLMTLGDGRDNRLLIVAHHLLVDSVSWRILLEDLQLVCQQLQRGEAVKLGAKTSSFRQWAECLRDYAQTEEVAAEAPYWLETTRAGNARLPLDFPVGSNSRASASAVMISLSEAETEALLKDMPRVHRTEINDVLLTALARSLGAWSGQRALLVEMEGHGREEIGPSIDVTRTVGWFTTHYPLLLETGDERDRIADLKKIKEHLRSVPQHGLGCGLLRWMCNDRQLAKQLAEAPVAQVKFNYLGQLDRSLKNDKGFKVAPESYGETQSLDGKRQQLLEINGGVLKGQLHLRWTYSPEVHRRETIEKLSAAYVAELRGLIRQSLKREAVALTPSDFPAAQLTQKELDRFLATLISSNAGEVQTGPEIPEDLYRLSPMQEGLLFHNLYAPQSDVYFRQLSCTLHGSLDVKAFERAWQEIIVRHPVLRTSFHWENLKHPLQLVNKQARLPLAYQDWRELSAAEQGQEWESLLQSERSCAFELARAPLMRLVLVRLADDVHRFIWSYHHLLMDGWAKHSVFNQILALYRAYSQDQPIELESSRPYSDYIKWLQQQDMQKAESYWRQTLKGFHNPTPVGGDGHSKNFSSETFENQASYDKQRITLSTAATTALQNLARQHQLTLNTVVQGAWALFLNRISGHSDVVFGTVVSGRPASLQGVEKMVGLFINTLPVRVQVETEANVIEWLKRLQEQQVNMRQYEYSPLVKVQAWSETPRGTGLFETLMAFENYPVETQAREQSATVRIGNFQILENNNFPLTLMVGPGTELGLLLIYDARRFDHTSMASVLQHLETILINIATLLPETTLRTLQESINETRRQQETLKEQELKDVRLQKFKQVKRKVIRGSLMVAEEGT